MARLTIAGMARLANELGYTMTRIGGKYVVYKSGIYMTESTRLTCIYGYFWDCLRQRAKSINAAVSSGVDTYTICHEENYFTVIGLEGVHEFIERKKAEKELEAPIVTEREGTS